MNVSLPTGQDLGLLQVRFSLERFSDRDRDRVVFDSRELSGLDSENDSRQDVVSVLEGRMDVTS